MRLHQAGGIAALMAAGSYLCGFALFFGVLDPGSADTPARSLDYVLANRDAYFLGYLITGIVFSLALILLVQVVRQRLGPRAPALMDYTALLGYLWAGMVLASSFIFLTYLGSMQSYQSDEGAMALTLHRSIALVVDALGGGIELLGALWVLLISYTGLRVNIFSRSLHYWGALVGIAGVLTLFSGLPALSEHDVFELTTAIFGLGQIVWFVGLGWALLRGE